MEDIFFELIRVAIGSQDTLTRHPSAEEWKGLYDMAQKQSLVGVCFAGVQKLHTLEALWTIETLNLAEVDYLRWMGVAAKIQQRNELMKAKGDCLLSELRNNKMDVSILKGQSLSDYYADLADLRQSGDIDVWVKNRSVMELDGYVRGLGFKPHTTAAHVSYEDKDVSTSSVQVVEIELHAEPAFFRSFRNDKKLKKLFKEFNGSNTEFNLVYMMVHMYHHVLFDGLGLRQLMDYYLVLRTTNKEVSDSFKEFQKVSNTIESLGMLKFAQGIMWIMKEVFALEDRYLICEASEKYGRLILEDVMSGGNFGHHDEKNKGLHGGTALGRSLNGLKRNMKFFALGPWEILCSPVWSLWHWIWRKRRGLL